MGDELKETPVIEEKKPAVQEDYAELIEAYADQINALQAKLDEFSERLETEQTERKKVEEKFAESEKARRLMHFSDVVSTLAVGTEPEQFAEDLYAIESLDAELAERMLGRFRAMSNAAESAGIFSQKSKAQEIEHNIDPFLAKVESARKEHFAEKPYAEGYTDALQMVSRDEPDLARDYAERTRRDS